MLNQIFTFALVGFFVSASLAQAAMSSTNFEINWDTVSTGGSDTTSSATYTVHNNLESTVAGTASSTSYQLQQGYRIGNQVIVFTVAAQVSSSARTATSLSGLTVTVGTSGLAVGDLVALVQDVGASQISAIGEIRSIGSGTITVYEWKNAGSAPVIDGTNDNVYLLSGATLSLGDLSTSTVGTGIVAFEVSVHNESGYVVQILEDGNLRSGSYDIDDVVDGSVSAGSEEYGGRSSDTTLSNSTFDTADTALTTTFQDVATESLASFDSRNFVTLKAAMSSSSGNVAYSNIVTFVVSGNF